MDLDRMERTMEHADLDVAADSAYTSEHVSQLFADHEALIAEVRRLREELSSVPVEFEPEDEFEAE